jgi:hypothetical protein
MSEPSLPANLIHAENRSITLGPPFWRAIFYPVFPDLVSLQAQLRERFN